MQFVYNDGGRSSIYIGIAGDCVVRAIAIATDKPYKEVYDEINVLAHGFRAGSRGRKSGARNGVYRQVYEPYLKSLGWKWTPTMHVGSGCKVHLQANELPRGRIIVRLSRHLAAVIDGVVHDTHDPSRNGTRCVYGYFSK